MSKPRAALAVAATLLAGACAQSPSSSRGPEAGQPARSPYLVMVDARSGWAVVPSRSGWALLHTGDGWASATNATPPAVPTGGGLLLARVGAVAGLAVGVLPVDRLTVSPVLYGGVGSAWTTAELPGGLVSARGALAAAGNAALLTRAGGTLVRRAPGRWITLTDASHLAPGSGLRLDAVTWANARRGWLTGHAPAGAPVAFSTDDGGRTWDVIARAGHRSAAALAPCDMGTRWLLPVSALGGSVRLMASADSGGTWTTGAPIPAAAKPAWGCDAQRVWLVGGSASGERLYSSADAGASWQARAPAPAGLTDLAPTGGGAGWAMGLAGDRPVLWQVSGDGAVFRRTALPRVDGVQPG